MSRKGSSVQWKEEAERNRKDNVDRISKELTVKYNQKKALIKRMCLSHQYPCKQARKPRSYASPKL